jgi:hypothetical protein
MMKDNLWPMADKSRPIVPFLHVARVAALRYDERRNWPFADSDHSNAALLGVKVPIVLHGCEQERRIADKPFRRIVEKTIHSTCQS